MQLTNAQLAERIHGVGASEVGAVVGRNPKKSAYDVWLEKTGRVQPEDLSKDLYVRLGHATEPFTLLLAGETLQRPVVECPETFRHRNGIMLANIDGMVEAPKLGSDIVEAKSNWRWDCGWGEEGSDNVPDPVWCQVQQQMLCSDSGLAWVARLLGGRGKFSLYRVERADDETMELIETRVLKFWHHNVQKDIPPEDSLPCFENMARVKRVAQVVTLDPAVVSAFLKANTARKEAEKLEEKCKAALLASLRTGDGQYADAGECEAGTVTYREHQRKGYVVEPSSYRKLDVKPIKGAGT